MKAKIFFSLFCIGFYLFAPGTFQPAIAATSTYQITGSANDVNEDGATYDATGGTVWLGTGATPASSYTGLRFQNVTVPQNAVIQSAVVEVYSATGQWNQFSFTIAAENSGNASAFSSTSKPSQKTLTSQTVAHSSNVNWAAGTWIQLNDITTIIQAIVNRTDWNSGNALSLIMKGTGTGAYGRKFVTSVDGSAASAPRLVVTYATSTTSSTPAPTSGSSTPTPTVTQTSGNLGDIDGDLKVGISDFNEVVGYFGRSQTNPYLAADLDHSGRVWIEDFNEVIAYFGTTYSGATATPTPTGTAMSGESMAMQNWQAGGKNAPNIKYDYCDDSDPVTHLGGTDVSVAHKAYYVIAYDGLKYPTWHPAVVTNPITGSGKCYFGHEHGSDPQKYLYWNEIVQHFGKDQNGDGTITPMVINVSTGAITPGDRAGIPFGIANEHMDMYYNQEGVDSIFVRHEDHVGHKIEFVNKETDINTTIDGNVTASTNEMTQLAGTNGLNVPYYTQGSGDGSYKPTGVVCTHLHKFHQGTHSGDAIRNNLHEVIFHSSCQSVDVNGINAKTDNLYPDNTVLLTGMMAFGNPGEYVRFCFADRFTKVCPDGKNADGSCVINDPLLSKMPNAINSTALGRNMVDKYCLQNWSTLNPGNNYFGPYEIWEGDLAIFTGNSLSDSSMIAEHGRQWDVLDPIRFNDVGYQHPTRTWQKDYQFNSENCAQGGAFDGIQYIGGCNSRTSNVAWDSPASGFRGLKRTTYFGRNRVSNGGGSQIWWTNPLGGNAVTTQFASGLKQRISPVEANIQTVQSRIQQLYGSNNFLNDRALQRAFNSGGSTVHAPN